MFIAPQNTIYTVESFGQERCPNPLVRDDQAPKGNLVLDEFT